MIPTKKADLNPVAAPLPPTPSDVGSAHRGGLKRTAVRGWAVTMSGQGAKFLIQLGSTAIVARQLSPTDYGLVAMVTSLLGFITMFKDLGLSQAAIQKQNITPAQVNGLFWINVGVGLAFAMLLALIAPLIGKFYGHPELVWITLAFAAMAPVSSLGAQHSAMLQRTLQYTSLAIRDIAASLSGAIAGIIAALHGYGYWSLVIMQAVSALFSTAALWWQADWRPSMPRFSADLKPLLRFGSAVTLSNFLGYLMNGLDSVLLGYFIGPVGLGVYNRAQNTLAKPLQQLIPPVMHVAYGVFARVSHDRQKFESATLQLGFLIAVMGCLVAALSLVCADWIVLVMLGPNWLDAVPIVRVLSLFGFVEPMASFLATLLIARGLPGALVRWRVISATIIVGGFFAGLPWGPLGVATAYSASGLLIRMPLFVWFACRKLNISPFQVAAELTTPVISGVGTAVALMSLRQHNLAPENIVLALGSYGVMGTTLYGMILYAVKSSRTRVQEVLALILHSYQKRK